MKTVLCVSIEASGDRLLAEMIRTLKTMTTEEYAFIGVGGPISQQAGLESIIGPHQLAAHGLIEAVKVLPQTWSTLKHLKRLSLESDLVFLVDAPEINMRLLSWVRRHRSHRVKALPIIYVAPPQAWAWRPKRVKKIGLADKVGCLFTFTSEWMRAHGVDAHYIGHPLVEGARSVASRTRDKNLKAELSSFHVALFPGSRASSVSRALPLALLGLVRFVEVTGRDTVVSIAYTRWVKDLIYMKSLSKVLKRLCPKKWQMSLHLKEFSACLQDLRNGQVTQIEMSYTSLDHHCLTLKWVDQGDRQDKSLISIHPALDYAHVALCHAGTSTLEAALAEVPPLTIAPLSWLSHQVIKRLALIPYCALPNLCLGEHAFPELLPEHCTVSNIAEGLEELYRHLPLYRDRLHMLGDRLKPLDKKELWEMIYPYSLGEFT